MSPLRSCAGGAAAGLALLLGTPGSAAAQHAAHGPTDWPCVQRLIPELAPATIWPGPPIEELESQWWQDDELARVVRFAAARETPVEDAMRRVEGFVERIYGEERERRLTLLFAGLFQEIDRRRSRTIEAVRRYARGQVGRLERISALVDELEERRGADGVEQAILDRLEGELFWQRRVFQDRQAALRALCEQPYGLEQRLGHFARAIQAGF
jgi:hypothetical protein